MKKYELTNERLRIGVHCLFRIRALKDFGDACIGGGMTIRGDVYMGDGWFDADVVFDW